MTKEQLEKLKTALENWRNSTGETFPHKETYYMCCDNKAWRGHKDDCLAMECIRIVEKEIDVLETEEQIRFQNGLKYP